MGSPVLTGGQIRAARGLLGWSQKELAEAAQLGFATIQRSERRNETMKGTIESAMRIRNAFEEAGIEFIDGDDHKGPGVRLSRPLTGAV